MVTASLVGMTATDTTVYLLGNMPIYRSRGNTANVGFNCWGPVVSTERCPKEWYCCH